MQRRIRVALYAFFTAGMMIAIFLFSAQNGMESNQTSIWLLNTRFGSKLMRVFPHLTGKGPELDIRKYAHMAEYAALAVPAFLLIQELFSDKGPAISGIICVMFCYLYACSDEIHQAFVPGRSSAFSDTLVDLAGTVIGILPLFTIRVLRKEPE